MKPAPHGSLIVVGRVGSSEQAFKISRVGSGGIESGQEVLKYRGSGRVGSGQVRSAGFKTSPVGSDRIGSGRVKISRNLCGSDRFS